MFDNGRGDYDGIFFINETTGYGAGQDRIVKTTDGGITWNYTAYLTSNYTQLHALDFYDENNGLVVGHNGLIAKYDNTLTLEPCPTVGEYCNCNESGTNFNLQIQNFYEELNIGTGSSSCGVICERPSYGSNIPISTAFIWREVVGATNYSVEIANADGSAIADFPYETGTLIISPTGYEEHREGELFIRKLTQSLDFETEYQIKITAYDASQNVLGCATHDFTTYQATQQNAGCVDEKQALTHFNNVIAFCNDYDENECNSAYLSCSHYQCTNLVNRYYASVYNVDLGNAGLSGQITARNYISSDLNYFDYSTDNDNNASVFPPKPGDIVVFTANPSSHVAICKSYDESAGTIEIMQQNSSTTDGGNAVATKTLSSLSGGWMRLKTLNVDLRETQTNQIALPINYNEIVNIANSTPTFQWTHIADAEYILYLKRKRDNNFCFEQIDGMDFPITISASENDNTGFSLGQAGIVLEQGEYLCRIGAIIDDNVGTIWSERFYFNINSDNSTVLPVIPADELTIIARTTTKKSNRSVIASNIDISRQNGSAWELIGTTNQNGNLFTEIYPPLEVGEQLQAQAEGYVTQQITITNEILQNGIVNINLEEDLSSDFIRNPSMTILEYAPIITQNPVNIHVDAENYTNFDIITINGEEEDILYSGTPSTNSTTFTFDYEGIHNIIVRFSNDNHSVEINQYVNYQASTTPENSYNVTVISTANSIGADVYINNEFVKTIASSNEIFSVPTGTNNFNFSKDGYSTYFETTTDETTINLDLTVTNIENINQLDKLLVFPNPANDLITVSFGKVNSDLKVNLWSVRRINVIFAA